jgi:hypothetical protein
MTRTESLDELTSLRRNITPEENQLVGLGVLNAWANRTRKGYLVCGPLTDETNRHGLNAVKAIDKARDDARWMIWREESYHYARTEARLAVRSALAAVGIKGAL